jgi:hypothetical protein
MAVPLLRAGVAGPRRRPLSQSRRMPVLRETARLALAGAEPGVHLVSLGAGVVEHRQGAASGAVSRKQASR